MSLARKSWVERVVIVFNSDGAFKAAHQERVEEVRDGDAVLSTRPIAAEPIDAATLAKLLPGRAGLLAQIEKARTCEKELRAALTAHDRAQSAGLPVDGSV